MTLEELVSHLRLYVLNDAKKPYLWSEDELTVHLNEAQNQFARRTHQLSDDTSAFTFIETEKGVSSYALDSRIVFVKEIRHEDGTMLGDRTRKQMSRRWGEGKPQLYTLDAAHKTLRLNPTPDGVYTLDLLVARKPLAAMVDPTDSPEIEEDYHLALCEWVAYRALRKHDADALSAPAADSYRAEWEMKLRDAKRDVFRLRSGDNPVARQNWTGKTR